MDLTYNIYIYIFEKLLQHLKEIKKQSGTKCTTYMSNKYKPIIVRCVKFLMGVEECSLKSKLVA